MSRANKLAVLRSRLTSFSERLTTCSLPSFLIPHITVPACLSGLAFWKAGENHGSGVGLSNGTSLVIGAIIGGLFGVGSASTFYHDRKMIKKKVADHIVLINQYINSDEAMLVLSDEKVQCIHSILFQCDAQPNLPSSAYLLNAFATFTTMITSYATSSLFFFISDDQPAYISARWIVGIVVALTLGLFEMILAHKGQQQDNHLKVILATTEAIKRILLAGQNEALSSVSDQDDQRNEVGNYSSENLLEIEYRNTSSVGSYYSIS